MVITKHRRDELYAYFRSSTFHSFPDRWTKAELLEHLKEVRLKLESHARENVPIKWSLKDISHYVLELRQKLEELKTLHPDDERSIHQVESLVDDLVSVKRSEVFSGHKGTITIIPVGEAWNQETNNSHPISQQGRVEELDRTLAPYESRLLQVKHKLHVATHTENVHKEMQENMNLTEREVASFMKGVLAGQKLQGYIAESPRPFPLSLERTNIEEKTKRKRGIARAFSSPMLLRRTVSLGDEPQLPRASNRTFDASEDNRSALSKTFRPLRTLKDQVASTRNWAWNAITTPSKNIRIKTEVLPSAKIDAAVIEGEADVPTKIQTIAFEGPTSPLMMNPSGLTADTSFDFGFVENKNRFNNNKRNRTKKSSGSDRRLPPRQMGGEKKVTTSTPAFPPPRSGASVSTEVTTRSTISCRDLSIQRLLQSSFSKDEGGSMMNNSTLKRYQKRHTGKIKKLVKELQQANDRQKKLERQLEFAGVDIAEDIPYEEAKQQVARIAARMLEIGSSEPQHPDPTQHTLLRQEYYQLEKDMEKYTTALMLTDEYVQEQLDAEKQWEEENLQENERSLQRMWSHMPVEIRQMTIHDLTTTRAPNGKHLPEGLAKRMKRTNVLQLLRMDPDTITRSHPSNLESLRVSGLSILERRALHLHLQPAVEQWTATGESDPFARRKLTWFGTMKSNFKEHLAKYQHHVNNITSTPTANDEKGKKPKFMGRPCPMRAEALINELYCFEDVNGKEIGYGFPCSLVNPEYEASMITSSASQSAASDSASETPSLQEKSKRVEHKAEKQGKVVYGHVVQEEMSKIKLEPNEAARRLAVKEHYQGNPAKMSWAESSLNSMIELMDKLESDLECWIRERRNTMPQGNASDCNTFKSLSPQERIANLMNGLLFLKQKYFPVVERSGIQVSGGQRVGRVLGSRFNIQKKRFEFSQKSTAAAAAAAAATTAAAPSSGSRRRSPSPMRSLLNMGNSNNREENSSSLPDERSRPEVEQSEEVHKTVMEYLAGVQERAEEYRLDDRVMLSMMNDLKQVSQEMHERNLETMKGQNVAYRHVGILPSMALRQSQSRQQILEKVTRKEKRRKPSLHVDVDLVPVTKPPKPAAAATRTRIENMLLKKVHRQGDEENGSRSHDNLSDQENENGTDDRPRPKQTTEGNKSATTTTRPAPLGIQDPPGRVALGPSSPLAVASRVLKSTTSHWNNNSNNNVGIHQKLEELEQQRQGGTKAESSNTKTKKGSSGRSGTSLGSALLFHRRGKKKVSRASLKKMGSERAGLMAAVIASRGTSSK